MEIERKFLLKELPQNIDEFESHKISQGYISVNPVVRIRQFDDSFFLTIKSSGLMKRIEVEKELTAEEFDSLSVMIKGNIISKTRYKFPFDEYTIELDIFEEKFKGLNMAEIEFPNIEKAESFITPDFLHIDVTNDPDFQNSRMSDMSQNEIKEFLIKIKDLTI